MNPKEISLKGLENITCGILNKRKTTTHYFKRQQYTSLDFSSYEIEQIVKQFLADKLTELEKELENNMLPFGDDFPLENEGYTRGLIDAIEIVKDIFKE